MVVRDEDNIIMFNKHKSSGQSLIEVVMAFAVSILILVSLVNGVVVSLRNIRFARNKTLAVKYAQEGIEATRSIKERSWNEILNGSYGLLWSGGQWSFVSGNELIDEFSRVVEITDSDSGDPEIKNVTVTVSWSEGRGTPEVVLNSAIAKLK